jgi:hypothetical protein
MQARVRMPAQIVDSRLLIFVEDQPLRPSCVQFESAYFSVGVAFELELQSFVVHGESVHTDGSQR